MNQYTLKHRTTPTDRSPVFNWVIKERFQEKPIKILEIGATRDLDVNSKAGDGWADFYFCDYISKFGGSIDIVDISQDAINACKIMLGDFIDKININFHVEDGIKWKMEGYDLIFLDGGDLEWQTYEMFKKIDLRTCDVLLDDFTSPGGKCDRIKQLYPFYKNFACNHVHNMGFYYKFDNFGDEKFKIGSLELPYFRGWKGNKEACNDRAPELGLARFFAEKFNNNIIELGAVCHKYEFFKNWMTIDPFDVYPESIRLDILDVDYRDKNVLSISTIEHVNSDYGKSGIENHVVMGLKKILKESYKYLLTFPIGANRELEDYIRKQDNIPFTILKRKNFRGLINNWIEDKNLDNFYLNYGHPEYALDFYGNSLCLVVITNLKEIV